MRQKYIDLILVHILSQICCGSSDLNTCAYDEAEEVEKEMKESDGQNERWENYGIQELEQQESGEKEILESETNKGV